MARQPRSKVARSLGSLTDVGEVVRKLLPKLRQRVLPDAKGTTKTWKIDDLAQEIHYSKAVIRKAIKALKEKAGADIVIDRDRVSLNGPKRINYREKFSVGPAPSTPLATNFRRHGVLIRKNLTASTSWSQLTEPSLTNGKPELVLTLHKSLMSTVNGITQYNSLGVSKRDWEALPANKERRSRIDLAICGNDGLVRVIRVVGKEDGNGVDRIKTSEFDTHYWRIDEVRKDSGRFSATRTDSKVKTVPLSATES